MSAGASFRVETSGICRHPCSTGRHAGKWWRRKNEAYVEERFHAATYARSIRHRPGFMISKTITWTSSFLVSFRNRRRVGSVLLYGGIALLPQVASGTLAILYTRAFSPEEYANYGIFAAAYAAIATLLDLGLSSGIFRNYYGAGKSARDYFSAAITGTRLIMAAAIPIMAIVLYVGWDALGVRFSQKWVFIPALLAIAYENRTPSASHPT